MKKKIFIIFAVVMALAMCLAACTDKKEIETISVDRNSVKTVYTVGDTPDFSGIKVLLSYTDGTTEELGYDDVTISGADTSTAGDKTVTVKYKDLTATFNITVNEVAVTVTAIKIIVPQDVDTTVLKGSQFDTTKLQIEATFSDGSKKALSLADVTISSIDTSTVGEKTLTITYGSLSDSIKITVIDIASMQVVGGTLASKVFVGETLDVSKVALQVTYSSGKSEPVYEGFVVSALDTATYGQKKVTITYKGFSIDYNVEVVGPKELVIVPGTVDDSVKVFDTLDVSGIEVKLVYSDGTNAPQELTAADLTITNIDSSTAGKKTLKVAYNGLETTMEIDVVGVKSIDVSTGTIKNEILKGEALNTSGAVLNVVFTDDTTATVQAANATFGSIDTSTGGVKKLSITYLDKTVEYDVKVCVPTSIRVEGINTVVPEGNNVDTSNMKVFIEYDDATDATDVEVTTGISTELKGDINSSDNKQFVITYTGEYGEFSKTLVITTTDPVLERLEIRGYDEYVEIGNVYNKNSVIVYAIYGNETEKKITNATISDVNTTTAGAVKLTVSYTENEVTKTAEVEIKVLPVSEIRVSGIANKVNKGGVLDTTGAVITVIFSDGTYTTDATINANDPELTISTPDTTSGGDKYLNVTFRGKTVQIKYHVVAVQSIVYHSGLVEKVRFGYAVDVSNLKVTINYTDGTSKNVLVSELGVTVNKPDTKAFTLSETMTPVVPETCAVTFVYDGVTFNKDIAVLEISYVTALNGTVPGSIFVGDTTISDKYSSGEMKLSVVYEDGQIYLENINDTALIKTIMPDFTTGGEKAIVFKYMPVNTPYDIDGDGYFTDTNAHIFVYAIEKIEIVKDSIVTTVPKGANFSTEGLQIKVFYSVEGVYAYVDTTDDLLEIEGTIDTNTVGAQTLKVTYRGAETTLTVNVEDNSGLVDGAVYGAILPDNLVARESYKPNFKQKNNVYIVGDDNPYKFYLNVMVLNDKFEIQDVPGDTVKYTIRVYLGDSVANGTLLEGDELTKYVAIDSANNTYDFTDAAIGKTFTLSICPESISSEEDSFKSHTVKVVNGYNVYDPKELNFITNYWDNDMDGSDVAGDNDQLTAVYNLMKKEGFYTDRDVDGNGVADLYDYYLYVDSIRAIVVHNNLDITPSDIPSEYTYTHNKNGTPKAEFLEQLGVYERRLTAANPTFDIYGNYFSIFSYNLPCVVPAGIANNGDEYSSTSLIKIKLDSREFLNYPNGDFPFANYQTNFRDLSMRDNDPNSNDQSASERHMRGIQAFKVGAHTCTITNVNSEAYAITLITENDYTTLNLDSVKFYNSWQGHLFLWGGNEYQDAVGKGNQPSFSTNNGTVVNIKESLLGKCGGPVILAQHPDREDACNDRSRIDVIADEASELYSYVTGQEAWFVAVGQTQTAAQIIAMNQLLQNTATAMGESASYTSKDFIQGVSTVNMIMVNMGTGTGFNAGENYTGSFTKGGVKALDMVDPASGLTQSNPYAQGIIDATGGKAPVFQSNVNVGNPYAGEAASSTNCVYSDGATGVFLSNQAYPPTGSDIYKGDYVTLYYQGMGIMLEYYH